MALCDLLKRFDAVTPADRCEWREVLSRLPDSGQRVFWYAASGLHLDPLFDYTLRYTREAFEPLARWLAEINYPLHLEFFLLDLDDYKDSLWRKV